MYSNVMKSLYNLNDYLNAKLLIMNSKAILVIAVGMIVGITTIPLAMSAETELIPSWIKNTAGFWADDKISDVEFMNAIEYLITQGTIQVPNLPGVSDVDTITIGFIPSEKAEELTPKAEEFEKFLEQSKINQIHTTSFQLTAGKLYDQQLTD